MLQHVRASALAAALVPLGTIVACPAVGQASSSGGVPTPPPPPPVACVAYSVITSNFNGTRIEPGSTVWFNSVFKLKGAGSAPVTVRLQGSTIEIDGTSIAVPPATVTFDPEVTGAATVFDGTEWITVVPPKLSGNTFLAGVALPVPFGLPGGIKRVTWSGLFSSDTPGVKISWKWGAAVYTDFDGNYDDLGVKPVDDNKGSIYLNSDHAGTPEHFKEFVTGGARGGGGSNFTGSYSGTAGAVCE